MQHKDILFLTEDDLQFASRTKHIVDVNFTDLSHEIVKKVQVSDAVIFLDKNNNAKILKDRYDKDLSYYNMYIQKEIVKNRLKYHDRYR